MWDKFESAVVGHQGLINAKNESNEACRKVIADRAEPTPYTILINQIDPALAKRGLFGTLQTGLDVMTVLEESVGSEFVLVDAKLGGATGKLWWFAEMRRTSRWPKSRR